MGFIESYKHLDKLCGEILNDDRRVSAYIDEMRDTPRGYNLVPGWEEDLKKLKHYRWVRNQIAHEPDCTESNMCAPEDTEWLENFYARIMNRRDPLALYREATKPRPTPKVKQAPLTYSNVRVTPSTYTVPNTHTATSTHTISSTYTQINDKKSKQSRKSGCLLTSIAVLLIVIPLIALAALIYFVFHCV